MPVLPTTEAMDADSFRRFMARNIRLPLALGGFSAVLFISVLIYLLNAVGWVEHTQRVIGSAHEISKLTVDAETGLRGFLITRNEVFLQPYEVSKPRIASELAALAALIEDNPPQVSRLNRIADLQLRWNAFAEETIEIRRQNQDVEKTIASGQGKNLTDEIRREYNAFIGVEQRLLLERTQTARAVTFWSVGGYLFFILGLSGLLAYWGRRDLLWLSSSYNVAINKQQEIARQLAYASWLRGGQSQLAEHMIAEKEYAGLGQRVLGFMTQYVSAAVGAIYAQQESGQLRQIANFGLEAASPGLSDSEPIHNAAPPLVAQAALENRVLGLTDLPDPYFLPLQSGLGSGITRQVLIVPLTHAGRVNGVLEIGFLRPIQTRDREFLELTAANIGTALEAIRSYQQLQKVLRTSQLLNEELQSQQEELRAANEQLQSQSEVLKNSQSILEKQQTELEHTNQKLALQALTLDEKNTSLGQIQAQLLERAEALRSASQYKSEFLANMSHELRTPLNSALILAKLLGDNSKGNLDAEQVRFALSIYSAGNDLLLLINDILDISKVEAGKLDLAPERFTVNQLAESLHAVFAPVAAQKNLRYQIVLAQGSPPSLVSDRLRVEQILKNLLSNAFKFTDSGYVTLTVSECTLPEETGGDLGIAFAVEDSGIGIEASQQQLIFEAFQQADGTTSRRYGGTGLGLSISRDLAQLLGGGIEVASSPGKGSIFSLRLPLEWRESAGTAPAEQMPGQIFSVASMTAEKQPSPPSADASKKSSFAHIGTEPPPAVGAVAVSTSASEDDRHLPPSGRQVLVIEDDRLFSRILADLAHEMHYQCLIAHTAHEGLALAQQFLPTAILLDMGLPDRPGITVLQQLKDNPKTRHIPVHVVSSDERREPALKLGAIGYAIKPATREALRSVFEKLEKSLSQKVKRVLLVEDDELQRNSVMELIGDKDVEITAVDSGKQALAMLHAQVFDCMIIDLKLPDIQGNELLRRMATEDITAFPPVIVYTGRNLTRAEEAELMRYSRSIIIKGARSPERLLDEVTLFLHKVESELPAERQSMLQIARSRDKVFEGRKILLVDDDARNIFALTSALEQMGFAVVIGRNGQEALNQLDEGPDIDLVMMDIMMPVMDGLEAMRQIRSKPQFSGLPIIAVTAKAMKDDQTQCLQAGANDYLAKPIDLDRLASLLRVWLPALHRL